MLISDVNFRLFDLIESFRFLLVRRTGIDFVWLERYHYHVWCENFIGEGVEGFDLIIDFKIWVVLKFVFQCESLEIFQFELGFYDVLMVGVRWGCSENLCFFSVFNFF